MTADQHIALVARYFDGVDTEDLDKVLSTLTEDCVFTVETHDVRLQGHDQIASMLRRLWANHRAVCHKDFRYLNDPAAQRIAAQFTVENTELDGTLTLKSNCNVFDLRKDRFCAVAVYMAGLNTLEGTAG